MHELGTALHAIHKWYNGTGMVQYLYGVQLIFSTEMVHDLYTIQLIFNREMAQDLYIVQLIFSIVMV